MNSLILALSLTWASSSAVARVATVDLVYNGKNLTCSIGGHTLDSWEGSVFSGHASRWLDCGPLHCYFAKKPSGAGYAACNTKPKHDVYKKFGTCTYHSSGNYFHCTVVY